MARVADSMKTGPTFHEKIPDIQARVIKVRAPVLKGKLPGIKAIMPEMKVKAPVKPLNNNLMCVNFFSILFYF